MLAIIESSARRLRRWLSPSEWAIRLLRLPASRGTANTPGLVLIQIDGLSRTHLHRAMHQHRMPFLRHLLQREGYRIRPVYPGLPASTPSVQAELFYGVRMAVPAFNFRDRDSGSVFRMYDPPAAAAVERRLAGHGPALLEGGSAWTNIFSGGAAESHFCASTLGWGRWLQAMMNPVALLMLLATHIHALLRLAALMAWECVLALLGSLQGILTGRGFGEEVLFVFTRVGICILLRELVVLGAYIDIARGLPIVHLNFIGYDEQAHRRGPSSAFAHRALPGIDHAIARIWRAAHQSARRHYDVWVYSDHGQEDTVPYPSQYFTTVQEAVAEAVQSPAASGHTAGNGRTGEQTRRINLLGGRWARRVAMRDHAPLPAAPQLVVTGMGALGHVYPPHALTPEERDRWSRLLVTTARIPLVLSAEDPQHARAWTEAGSLLLPDDAVKLFGAEHPYLQEIAADLVALCHHRDAGTFVISGWRRGAPTISFPMEYGSHTGPGTEETNAFALVPADAPLPDRLRPYLRPADLRFAALRLLDRPVSAEEFREQPVVPTSKKPLRIVTYNVHRCIGMDGMASVERIARVIARHHPDVVALQEVDIGRRRTGGLDQTELIARRLGMTGQFHPAMRFTDGAYGIAVMSRYPMQLVKADVLPRLKARMPYEPRAAIWVALDVDGTRVHVINVHLSLWEREQRIQADALLGPDWLGSPECRGPVILCGDFNAAPGSAVYRRLGRRLLDTQLMPAAATPQRTWFGRYPLSRIDHVFVGGHLDVSRIEVPGTTLDRVASDHLPLVVDLHP